MEEAKAVFDEVESKNEELNLMDGGKDSLRRSWTE